jgi:hypothetical protein
MREILVRAACFVANLVVGEPRLVVTATQEREIALARAGDPYFDAFRQRCMQRVYGDHSRGTSDS